MDERAVSEYVYCSHGEPLANDSGEIALARKEIVRCRDCRHMHTVRNWLGMDVDECWLHADRESGALGKARTEPDGFCAWAERKEVVR